MKNKDMIDICKSQRGICKNCKLNCIENWVEKLTTWCLLEYRIRAIKTYQELIRQGKDKEADRVREDYEKIERKYLK